MMRNKRIIKKMMLFLCVPLLIVGCGNKIPDMSQEQYNQTVEYAAGLLLKYSNNGVKKLTYLEPSEPVEGVDAEDKEREEEPVQPENTPDTNEIEEVTETMPEEPAVEAEDEGNVLPEEIQEESTQSVTIGDTQTLDNGLQISFEGLAVHDYYPQDASDFIISAQLGNRLLVLDFELKNTTGETVPIDMVTDDPVFRIAVNHIEQGRYRPTILDRDLSTVQKSLEANEKMQVSLVQEISTELSEQIKTVSLSVKYNGKTQKVDLKME